MTRTAATVKADILSSQADTAEALRLLTIIKTLSLRDWRDHLKTEDHTFLFDMSDKFHSQGISLFVSTRQLERLRRIWESLNKAGVV